MWFLLLQILLLLALTALFTAWLTHWWLRRNYEDVTESYTMMANQGNLSNAGLLTKTDFDSGLKNLGGPDLSPVENRLGSLERMVGNFTIPKTDLSPMESRLGTLERTIGNITFPKTDLTPIENRLREVERLLSSPRNDLDAFGSRFSGLENSLSALHSTTSDLQNTDTSRLERQMDMLATAIADRQDTNLDPIEARLAGLEDAVSAIRLPETDLGPIHSGLTRLEMSLANMETPAADLGPIEARISALHETISVHRTHSDDNRETILQRLSILSSKLGDLHNTDFTPLLQRLDDIETRIAHIHMPETDLRPVDEGLNMLHGRLADLESAVSEASRQTVDLTPLQQRLDQVQSEIMRLERMEGSIATLRMDVQQSVTDIDPLQQRIELLQRDIANQPAPDFTPVINSVSAMERRIDFAAMENRLTSIEYGLAALHHMLRTRQPEDVSYTAPESNLRDVPSPPPAFTAPPVETKFTDPSQDTDWSRSSSSSTVSGSGDYQGGRQEFDSTTRDSSSSRDSRSTRDSRSNRDSRGTRDSRTSRESRSSRREYDRTREPREPRESRSSSSRREYNRDRDRDRSRESARALDSARRPDDKANLLTRPAFGAPDDLEEISGVGPMLNGLLSEIGVYYFWQVAEWGPTEIEWVDNMLDGFNGRIERDDWVGQARILATGENAARRP